MEKIKIVLTRSMLPGDIQYIKDGLDKEIAGGYDFVVPADFSEEGIIRDAEDADILLGPFVTKSIIENAEKLRLVQVPWTGMDTFNFEAMKGAQVPVCNTHSNATAVAELGASLTLDLIKKVSYHDRKMRNGSWNRDQLPLDLKSKMLCDMTVCILGCGNIGYAMAKLFAAFGSDVIGVSGRRKPDGVLKKVYKNDEMSDACAEADIVISSLPLTPETKGLINKELIEKMKDGAFVVNVSRAGIVDEDAIYAALKSGKISGFAADVWWSAPKRGESQSYPSEKHEFHKLDNVVMSPHRAGFVEGSLPHLDGAISNIICLKNGAPLNNLVDVKKHY